MPRVNCSYNNHFINSNSIPIRDADRPMGSDGDDDNDGSERFCLDNGLLFRRQYFLNADLID